jgi:hyperosmotically inducible periplasmic protein
MKHWVRLFCVQAILLTSLGLWAQQDQTPSTDTTNTAPDNTKVNQRDRNPSQPTADQQTNAKSDREMTRQIRRAIVKDKSLSSYAHNIKIIAQNGMVTLKGPVKTEEEKQAIGSKAAEVVGSPDKVQNQIEVGSSDASAKPSPNKQ